MASIRETKPGHWRVVVSDGFGADGRRKRITRRVRGTKRDAETALTALLTQREQGATAPAGSVAELLERWLESAKAEVEATTWQRYEALVRLHVRPHVGAVPLRQLDVRQVEAWLRRLTQSGQSRASVQQARAVLRRAINEAMRWDMVGRNVASLARVPGKPPQDVALEAPSVEVIRMLIAAAGPDLADVIAVAAVLGLRRGEVAGLRWSDLDVEAGTLRVARAIAVVKGEVVVKGTKTHAERIVPVPPLLLARLRARRARVLARALSVGVGVDGESWMLSCHADPTEPWRPDGMSRAWITLRDRHRLSWRLHDLRHAAATHMLDAMIPRPTVSKILGHKTMLMLDRYGHAVPETARRATEGLSEQIL